MTATSVLSRFPPSHIFTWEAEPCLWKASGFLAQGFGVPYCPFLLLFYKARRPVQGSIDLGYLAHEYSLSRIKHSPRSTPGILPGFVIYMCFLSPFVGLIHIREISWKQSEDVLGRWQCSGWGLQRCGPLDMLQKRW